MSGLDIAIAVVVCLSVAVGILRGFIREVLSLAKWILAGLAGWMFADIFADLFSGLVEDPTLRLAASFIAIFLTIYLIGTILTYFLHKLFTSRPIFKYSNTFLGAIIGGIRAIVIIVFGFLFAGLSSSVQKSGWWNSSLLAPYFKAAALSTTTLLPTDIARHIRYD